MPRYTADEEIEMLVDAGLLTEREAQCFVQRRVEATPGYAVAEMLDVSETTVSEAVRRAERKLDEARDTLDALEEIRHQTPNEQLTD